ncbi:hypothetical protein [Coprobacter tertius]|uniref:AhpC/TSA family protein n=1 Tax=Coprobacter tertius TaxID=2944915 RepID=A0ABT1MJ53_9BACT|nr:hypothetical protein [Coprobacter tertius]MCP9612648.1 hypothetical protein [Coprobacter tertius]
MKYNPNVIIAVFIVLLIFSGFYIYNQKSEVNQLQLLNHQTLNEKIDLSMVQEYRDAEINLNGKSLAGQLKVSDEKGNPVNFEEMIDGCKLILYFSEFNCDICLEDAFNNLNSQIDSIGYENVAVLIDAENKRFVKQYKTNHNIKYKCFEVEKKPDGIFSSSLPFFFIVEKEKARINSAYIPQKEKPEDTKRYLRKIISDYFS